MPYDIANLLQRRVGEQDDHLASGVYDDPLEDFDADSRDLPLLRDTMGVDDHHELPPLNDPWGIDDPDDEISPLRDTLGIDALPELDLDIDLEERFSAAPSSSTASRSRKVMATLAKHRTPYVFNPDLPYKLRRREKTNRRNRKGRDVDRQKATAALKVDTTVKQVAQRKLAAATPITTTYVPKAFVWTGRKTVWNRATYTLDDMKGLGFTIVHWNGRCVSYSFI